MTSTALMARASRVTPALGAIGPRHSDMVSYDNMGSIFDATLWRYKGSPLNSAAVWNTERCSVFKRYFGQWAHKARCEWSYTFLQAGYVQADVRPAVVTGSINGYMTPPVIAALPASGTFQLYGARALNGPNAAADYTQDPDLARLMGPSSIAVTIPNMSGVADCATATAYGAATPFQGVLHDTTFELASSLFFYGSFSSKLEAGFVPPGQSPGFSYSTYLKSIYPNQAAYNAARDIGAVPYYAEYNVHLIKICLDYMKSKLIPRCREFGLSLAVNAYNSLPTEHSSSGLLAMLQADYGVSELLPFQWAYTSTANSRVDRLFTEAFEVPDRWRRTIGCAATIILTANGVGKRNAVAFHPPLEWLPEPVTPGGPPPTTAWPIGPKIVVQQRMLAFVALAHGASPVMPLGVYDIYEAYPTQFPLYGGYVGVNKPLWSMPVDLVRDLYQWIAQSDHLLDDFLTAPTVLMVEPFINTIYTGASYPASRFFNLVTDTIDPLMAARVPFAVATVGGDISQRPLAAYATSQVRAVVKMRADADYTAAGASIPTGANVLTQAALIAGGLAQWSPVTVSGERDGASYPLYVVPRVRSDGRAMVLHCLHSDSVDFAGGAGTHHDSGKPPGVYRTPRPGMTVTLKAWAWLATRKPRVTWWSPEAAIQGLELAAVLLADGLQIRLPALSEYGCVLLEWG